MQQNLTRETVPFANPRGEKKKNIILRKDLNRAIFNRFF